MTTRVRLTLRTRITLCIRNGGRLALHALSVMGLLHVFIAPAFGQQSQILTDDARALVTRIELSSGETFILPDDQAGAVWISLDPLVLAIKKDGLQSKRKVAAGKAETVLSGEHLAFEIATGPHARLVVVKPKMPHQDLTVGPFLQSSSLEDASDRNATLLVAISSCRFRETKNLGNESDWIPSKPVTILMKAGSVKWIGPGIYHFKNLELTAAKLISIEW